MAEPGRRAGSRTRANGLKAMPGAVIDDAVITLDAGCTVARWNGRAQALRGHTAAEVTGQPVPMFYTTADLAASLAERELRQAAHAGLTEFEGWRACPDGRWRSTVILARFGSPPRLWPGFARWGGVNVRWAGPASPGTGGL